MGSYSKDKRGNLIYRQNSFKRLLKNDSLKYHEQRNVTGRNKTKKMINAILVAP